MLVEFVLLMVGFVLAVWWFSVTILPILYGLPKAFYWCNRGLLSKFLLAHYLVPPVFWNLGLVGLAVVLVVWFPALATRLLESGGIAIGQSLGLIGSVIYVFTTSGSTSLRRDFVEMAVHYVVTQDRTLWDEFALRNRIHEWNGPATLKNYPGQKDQGDNDSGR